MANNAIPDVERCRKLEEDTPHSGVKESLKERRCHIVIGGGSSGILLCRQLLECDDVILIERGSQNPYSTHVTSRIPSLWPAAAFAEGEAFRNSSMPQSSLADRTIMYPQGSGIGGTSNLNAMILSAGHPAVFNNHWHQKWSSGVMDRYFDIVENIVTPRAYHTIFLQKLVQNCGCGSLERTDSSGILNEVISSIDNSQMKLIWDVNPIKSTYLTMISKTTDERINLRDALFRDHTANCQKEITAATKNVLQNPPVQNSCNFIGDVSQEPRKGKLTVLNHCSVISIEFDDLFHDELIETDTKTDSSIGGETGQGANYKKRQPKSSQEKLIAVGVKYFDQKSGINSQKLIRPSGGGEIILCAGAFESPRILLSSGLGGQTNVAASVNIQSSLPQTRPINLRGIGRNLQDHTMLPILCLGNWWTAASQVSLLKEQLTHTTGRDGGPLTTDPKTKSNVSKVVVFGIVGTVLSCVSAAYLCGGNYAEKVILESLSPLYLSLRRHIPTIVKDHASAFLHKANSVPVLSSIVLLVASLCVLSWSFSKDRPHGCDNFPLNRVHGYVLVDADGNVISKDSTEPPSAQLLLVDGDIAPGYLITELLLPRYCPSASSRSFVYMGYLRPLLSAILKVFFSIPLFAAVAGCSYGFVVCNVQPHSRGRLLPPTNSSGSTEDLMAPLHIDLGFLTDKRDVLITMNGMATARKLLLGQPINPSAPRPTDSPSSSVSPSVPTGSAGSYKKTPDIGFEVLPGLLFGDMEKVEDFTKFAQNYSTTYYHACGTCAMQTGRSAAAGRCLAKQKGDQGQESAGITNPGPESECECNDCLAVVDADLKVLGVLNLRVGDASVFPRISSGPTSATCMAVGIGLGRLILAEGREKSCL